MCEINTKMEENLKNHWLSKISEIKKENRNFFGHVPIKRTKLHAKAQTEPWLHFFGMDCSLARISAVIYQILQDAKEWFYDTRMTHKVRNYDSLELWVIRSLWSLAARNKPLRKSWKRKLQALLKQPWSVYISSIYTHQMKSLLRLYSCLNSKWQSRLGLHLR